jgi:transcriptional regulator with XRE-family HTH domain
MNGSALAAQSERPEAGRQAACRRACGRVCRDAVGRWRATGGSLSFGDAPKRASGNGERRRVSMIVQKMRLQHGWSQQQLADLSGLNVRTIQRVENGQSASLESFKALGAAFNVDFSELQEEAVRDIARNPEQTEVALAFSHVREIRRFYQSAMIYVVVMSALIAINLAATPHVLWVVFPALGWGLGLTMRALRVFDLLPWFGPQWERSQVEKRLGRRL